MLQSGSFTSGVYGLENLFIVPGTSCFSLSLSGQPSVRGILEPHCEEDWEVSKNTVYGLFKVINFVSNKKLAADDHGAVL